jgi:hypothetical protein
MGRFAKAAATQQSTRHEEIFLCVNVYKISHGLFNASIESKVSRTAMPGTTTVLLQDYI